MINNADNELHFETGGEEVLLPVREAWQPDRVIGYLPVPTEAIEASEKEDMQGIMMCYSIEQAPPGTQLSFLIAKYKGAENTLFSYDYPVSLLNRIDVFQNSESMVMETRILH